MKLGKLPYEHDQRTLFLGEFLKVPFVPEQYDFDKGRAAFPSEIWGNDKWENGVVVAMAHGVLRLRRLETRRSTQVSETDVIRMYQLMTGAQKIGDVKDKGMTVLGMLKFWKKLGFYKAAWSTSHLISIYGELDPLDHEQLRAACFLLGGIFLGFQLPDTARDQFLLEKRWQTPGSRPGTWGGQLVYAKKFDNEHFYGTVWGSQVQITNDFISKYCDECWAVLNSTGRWRFDTGFDIPALLARVTSIQPGGG